VRSPKLTSPYEEIRTQNPDASADASNAGFCSRAPLHNGFNMLQVTIHDDSRLPEKCSVQLQLLHLEMVHVKGACKVASEAAGNGACVHEGRKVISSVSWTSAGILIASQACSRQPRSSHTAAPTFGRIPPLTQASAIHSDNLTAPRDNVQPHQTAFKGSLTPQTGVYAPRWVADMSCRQRCMLRRMHAGSRGRTSLASRSSKGIRSCFTPTPSAPTRSECT